MRQQNSIVIVTRPTRLEGLRKRWGTLGQAKFSLAAARAIAAEMPTSSKSSWRRGSTSKETSTSIQADFTEYSDEDAVYQRAIDELEARLQFGIPVKTIDQAVYLTSVCPKIR